MLYMPNSGDMNSVIIIGVAISLGLLGLLMVIFFC